MSMMYVNAKKHNERFLADISALSNNQMKFILRLIKDTRRYCRSNTALHNYLNEVFKNSDYKFSARRVERNGKSFEITDIIKSDESIYESDDLDE